ncbi:hypothetical protein DFJ73DRAFT_827459 [Zopfochytrium polystomum]|nr:hypothetical protein DFJ73DRAFT_827459 [Zopfochytrium polystomum]
MGTLRSNLDFPVDNGGGGGAGGVVDRIVVINGDSGSRSTSDWRNSSFLREEEEALYSRMLAASARRGSNAGITETPWWMTMPDTSGSAESKSPEESMDRRKAWKSQGWAVSLGIGNDERATVTAVAGSKRNSAGSSTVEMPKRALASSRRGSAGSSLADVAVRPGASQTFPSQASPLPRSGVLRQKPGDLEWANLQSTSRAFGLA